MNILIIFINYFTNYLNSTNLFGYWNKWSDYQNHLIYKKPAQFVAYILTEKLSLLILTQPFHHSNRHIYRHHFDH